MKFGIDIFLSFTLGPTDLISSFCYFCLTSIITARGVYVYYDPISLRIITYPLFYRHNSVTISLTKTLERHHERLDPNDSKPV